MAEIYKKNTGHCPVLLLDNVSGLAEQNPQLLHKLQDIAADAADDRLFITVFVTSESHAPAQMMRKLSSPQTTMIALGVSGTVKFVARHTKSCDLLRIFNLAIALSHLGCEMAENRIFWPSLAFWG